MNKDNHLFNNAAVRTAAMAVLVASLALASMQAIAARPSAEDRVEVRITELRAQINITPAQENQWSKVTEVMRENAKRLDALTQQRIEHEKTMTAVEDMQSYGEIAAAHAEGIQQLTPVFADLYASMSDAQKKDADEAFRRGHRRYHHHRHDRNKAQ